MRGEHCGPVAGMFILYGPSPHARGTPAHASASAGSRRSIPASAGNTGVSRRSQATNTVHPRMRGEHERRVDSVGEFCGPSPHARGTHHAAWVGDEKLRSIPACAGNTRHRGRCRRRCPVHPRMRGEHPAALSADHVGDGPSPHARGTRTGQHVLGHGLRSIPACAGNTGGLHETARHSSVHPRMRGEH